MTTAPADAQVIGPRTAAGCVAVHGSPALITVRGRLTLRHVPGPPDFESIQRGDEDRPTLILLLPDGICVDDGGDFADASERFATAHVWSLDPAVRRTLQHNIGRQVMITGRAYARNNALHSAPLVLEATALTMTR